MPSDLFGLPQPNPPFGRIVLGGRFAPVTLTGVAASAVYWEMAMGKLAQSGLPFFLRSNKINLALWNPGILSAPYALEFSAWGAGAGNAANAITLTLQLGPDALSTITVITAADAAATSWRWHVFLTPGPTFKQMAVDSLSFNSAGATVSSAVATLTTDDFAQQSLFLTNLTVQAGETLTINGCLLELIPLIPVSIQDSVIG